MVRAHVLKRTGYKLVVLGLRRTLFLVAAIVLLLFSVPLVTRATTFPIVAKYIEPTQLKIDWDGINNAGCEHGVACDPNDPESYVLDVNTLEQRDILHFYDMGYNIAIIDWATPLEVGHTYKVQMRGQGFYRVSQEFVYTPSAPTNVADGATLVSQLNISSITNPILTHFVPALPALDENCLLNGVYDLSVDIYVNGALRQTVTGNCTYGLVSPDSLNFYTNNLFGDGNYNFVVHSASTGNTWRSNDHNYATPPPTPFGISNLTFNHSTGQYSFNYVGYHGGDITGESVAIHADGESWGYNHEPAACTGGASGSGTCAGTFNHSQGAFSCATTIYVQIYGFHQGDTISPLTNPDPSCASVPTPHDLFPSAGQATIDSLEQNSANDFQANLTLPGYSLDCWNDLGFTATVYSAVTNEPVVTMVNSAARHLCGYLDPVDHSHIWTVYPDFIMPSGTYWVYARNNSHPSGWVTGYRYFASQTLPNQAPEVTFTADNPTLNEGETFTASGSFSDPDSTAWTATVDYGDGSGVQPLTLNPDKTFSLSHLYVDNGSYTIAVSVTDEGNLSGTSTGSGGSVIVNNPAPVVPPITPPSNPGQGSPAVINVSFSDYGNQTHTAIINWGDGSGNQSVPVSGNDFSSDHNYQNPGTYTVTVIITDSEGATTTQTLTITVLNAVPVVGAINFPNFVAAASSYPLSVDFTDQGVADTHTATIDWGDSQTTNGVVSESNGSGSVSGSHTYASPGNYTVTVTVTDDDGGVGQNTTSTTAVNQISVLHPAGIWIGLKNSDDVGTKFDLMVEAYKDSTLVASGQLDSFAGGSSGFNNAHLATIPFDSFSPVDFPAGSVLSLKVYVRNACVGSGHNSGVARLWLNDGAANSRFGTVISGSSSDYYLRDAFALATTAGPGPKKTVDVQAGAKCSAFKPFGAWSKTL